jgi:hypothetical protein
VQGNSFGEGCAYRLDQHALKIQCGQQLFEGSALTRFASVIGRLGQGDAKGPGIHRHLGDKPVTAVLSLHRGAPQGLAVTHQLVETLAPAWDLTDHPSLEYLAELLQVGLVVAIGFREAEQVEKGGIRRPALEIQAQGLVQSLPMMPGEGLQVAGATAAAQDPQHRHQQQEPLRVAHPTAVASNSFGEGFAYGNRLEEAELIRSSATG